MYKCNISQTEKWYLKLVSEMAGNNLYDEIDKFLWAQENDILQYVFFSLFMRQYYTTSENTSELLGIIHECRQILFFI